MIDTMLNLLFRCSHRRLTRPVTPAGKPGAPHGDTYVVCLDCGKQFSYDLKEMKVGKPLDRPPEPGAANHKKLRFALWASLPLVVMIGSVLKKKAPVDAKSQPAPHRGGAEESGGRREAKL